MRHDFKSLKIEANGRWLNILAKNGIDISFLHNRNGPCPFCGGTDRWRWDNKSGDGSGYCHQCDARGDGFKILAKWLDLSSRRDFPKLLQRVAEVLGSNGAEYSAKHLDSKKCIEYQKFAELIWLQSHKLLDGSASVIYLRNRGLRGPFEISCLRHHPSLRYSHNGKSLGLFPALISKVTDLKGALIGIHRVFLSNDGHKADVPAVKKVLGTIRGGSVKFDSPLDILNLAEGIETALAVREATKSPTWAAISAGNLEVLEVPSFTKKVIIWADLDPTMAGERAANRLANRLFHQGIEVAIKMPQPLPTWNQDKADWLDIYSQAHVVGGDHV